MIALRARYVFPVDTAPIQGGIVAIDHDRIVSVGARPQSPVRDLGDVAILPGLVNPHTHLEFSDLSQPLGAPGIGFADWIRLVVRSRAQREPTTDAIALGAQESVRYGVTALGEIASTPWWRNPEFPLEITEFCEVIATRPDENESRYRAAVAAVQPQANATQRASRWTDTLRPGLSPHAPYSVHPELLRRLVALSAERAIPLAHHLAESREELELLDEASGPLVQMLKDLGEWSPEAIPRGSRPLDYLRMLSKAHRALVIHGNYLDDDEIDFLAANRERMSIVYCPRTHAYFQHDPYPLAKMLSVGVNVAIGTDSRASTPDLSPLREMQFAASRHPRVPPEKLLRMVTLSAAEALGRDAQIGSLTRGKFADLAIMALPDAKAADPHELLLDPTCPVAATVFRGRVVFGESEEGNLFSQS